MLDDLDQKIWGRGHRFVRYADTLHMRIIRLFLKPKRAAIRVLDQATKVLEEHLSLRVNRQKSTINPAVAILLGFGFCFVKGGVKTRIALKAFKRMKDRIRALTSRKWRVSMGCRIEQLNRHIRGWMGYFRLSRTPRKFSDLDTWFRRRMRQIRWKEGKLPQARIANLCRLGIRPDLAYQWA